MYRIIIRDLDEDKIVLRDNFDAFIFGAANKDEKSAIVGTSPGKENEVCGVINITLKAMAEKIRETPVILLGMAIDTIMNDLKCEDEGDDE